MIIVTGGVGFIGSCLISALNDEGIKDILIVDSLGKDEKWKNLIGKNYSDYQHKSDFLEKIKNNYFDTTKIDAIFHLGACSNTTEQDANYLINNNTLYTKELALYAINNNLNFYYASSAATYGDGKQGYNDDESNLNTLKPINMYGYSKHIFDQWAVSNNWLDKITGFKFFNVFGPNEDHKTGMTSIVYNAYHQIMRTGEMILFKSDNSSYKDGEQLRDFIYVKDVIKIMLWFLNNPHKKGLYNLGLGTATTWKNITEAVFKALNLEPKIKYREMPAILKGKYQYYTQANMKKLKETCPLKFSSIEDSVKDYVVNYLQPDLKY